MKKLCLLLIIAIGLVACEGDRGPQGPPGQDGLNGYLGQTFESTVNFGYDNNTGLFNALVEIPTDIEVFESDAVLVYRLENVVPDGQGGNADAWTLLPHNFFLDNQDMFQYVYNHTFFDVELIIDGNFDLSTLSIDFTDNQVFRFVIVPADFANDPNHDLTTYNNLLNELDNQDFQLETIQ